jgi:hypothetical protein
MLFLPKKIHIPIQNPIFISKKNLEILERPTF